ncbi:hypothetical protein F5Y16DRAFT_78360 [Xylariaceae sp. FL0255]|nr:hypothetical protein F5Y16DRAFT_78360 [Xylariaceae sp. FL0255]
MDSMDLDHDMDVDVDLVADEPIVPELDNDQAANRSDGEVEDDANARFPNKVYIRGLDNMNPNDVKAYVAQHLPDIPLLKIEWVDDSSANLVFADDTLATQALTLLAADSLHQTTPQTLLPAKPWSTRPEVILRLRPALESDRKQVGAASRSRFYLLHPEYDPEERRRRQEARRYRNRDGDRYSRRRGRDSEEPFDVNLYDDQPATRVSDSDSGDARREDARRVESHRLANRGRELFPDRDRSVSPGARDSDSARDRNRFRASAIKSHASRQTRTRELFPVEGKAESGRLGDKTEDPVELLARGITLPLMDGSNDVVSERPKGKLADRVSKADGGFSIRGTAGQKNSHVGFAIKGGAAKSVKELFPDKFGSNGNAGKELFTDGIRSKPRQRQKAGDLFD